MKHFLKHIQKHDLAKVLAGFSASEIFSHIVGASSGFFTKLQTFVVVPASSSMNTIMLVVWIVIFVGSVHYAWLRKK